MDRRNTLMPFALVTIGLLIVVTAIRGTHKEFGALVVKDFTGPGNFIYWIAAIGAIGYLGYLDSFRTFSRYFMALIIIGMLLSNRGFFDKLYSGLGIGTKPVDLGGNKPPQPREDDTITDDVLKVGGAFSQVIGVATTAAKLATIL